MLTKQQKALWEQLRRTLSRDQAIWFAGYVQGVTQPDDMAVTPATQQKLRVFFATETGNSKMVAQQVAKQAKDYGWNASPQPVKKIKQIEELQGDEPVIFITAPMVKVTLQSRLWLSLSSSVNRMCHLKE